MRTLVVALLAFVACKDGSSRLDQTPGSAHEAAPSKSSAPPAPSLPATPRPIVTVAEVVSLLPKIAGDEILPLKATPDGHQLHATWCIAGTGADGVAKLLGDAMTTSGWSEITTRGDATKSGVSGDRDRYRLSLVVTASDTPACASPEHYFASATVFRAR